MSIKERFHLWKAREILKRHYFHGALLICFTIPIMLLIVLDYLNIEAFPEFNQDFIFNYTWKGRMFYLFFIWLLYMESIIDLERIVGKKPKNHWRILVLFLFANIPTIYILSVNFLGVNQSILKFGQYLGLNAISLWFNWPLSFEYLVFTISSVIAIILAYKRNGLATFSISLSLIGGMASAYMTDTIYPFGLYAPLELSALPTAASTAAFFELLGYQASLRFPYLYKVDSQYARLPYLVVSSSGKSGAALIGWPCAGVHSLLLYVLIILVFFKRSEIPSFRKLVYFIFGLFGTYFVNILRISSYLIIQMNSGEKVARIFHDQYGELYFFAWILLYILLIVCIQRFMLVEKIRYAPNRVRSLFATIKKKV